MFGLKGYSSADFRGVEKAVIEEICARRLSEQQIELSDLYSTILGKLLTISNNIEELANCVSSAVDRLVDVDSPRFTYLNRNPE